MPVKVISNRIRQARQKYDRLATRTARTGAEASADAARERCPVSPHEKKHLIDTIRVEERRTKTLREAVVIAGDPSTDAAPPAPVEFGSGRRYQKPEGVEGAPSQGRQTPWVYFNPYTGQFVTTTGNDPQPFMGPSYPVGREAAERTARKGV